MKLSLLNWLERKKNKILGTIDLVCSFAYNTVDDLLRDTEFAYLNKFVNWAANEYIMHKKTVEITGELEGNLLIANDMKKCCLFYKNKISSLSITSHGKYADSTNDAEVKKFIDDMIDDVVTSWNDFIKYTLEQIEISISSNFRMSEIASENLSEGVNCNDFESKTGKYPTIDMPSLQTTESDKEDDNIKTKCPKHLADIFDKTVARGLMAKRGKQWEWLGKKGLYGYFIDTLCDSFNLKDDRGSIPWKMFEPYIINARLIKATARQTVNDYKNKCLPPPQGDSIIKSLLASN